MANSALLRNIQVFKYIKNLIDSEINKSDKSLFMEPLMPVYVPLEINGNTLVFKVKPVIQGVMKTLLVDGGNSLAYIALDILKALTFEVSFSGHTRDFYLKAIPANKELLKKGLFLDKDASDVDVLKLYDAIDVLCKQKELELVQNLKLKFNKEEQFLKLCKLDSSDLRFIPLYGKDFTKNQAYFLSDGVGEYFKYKQVKKSYSPDDYQIEVSSFLLGVFRGRNKFPSKLFSYSFDNGKTWNLLGR